MLRYCEEQSDEAISERLLHFIRNDLKLLTYNPVPSPQTFGALCFG